jgi:RNA polymerase sigma factor (sigma-70 family)
VSWPSDVDLLLSIKSGDRASFRVLYDRHVHAMYRYAIAIVGHPANAEEVVQEAWITLWRRRSSVFIATDSVLPWLLVTTRNHSHNLLRKQRKTVNTLSDGHADNGETDPAVAAELRESEQIIHEVISALTPIDRRIFLLCTVEGFSYKDAAAGAGISESALRNRLSRARRVVRANVIGRYGDG